MAKTRILIADDHAVFREGLRRILEQEKDLKVVGEASDGEEAVSMVDELKPDVVLMDIVMPKLSGVEATKIIKKVNPLTCILILTAYSDIHYILGLMEAGASGYLLKSARAQEVVESIRDVRSGESILNSMITRQLLERVVRLSKEIPEEKNRGHLSPREIVILRFVARGMSNPDIAEKLELSPFTVIAHLRHIFNKMRCSCRTEAITKGLQEGYVTLEDIPRGIESFKKEKIQQPSFRP